MWLGNSQDEYEKKQEEEKRERLETELQKERQRRIEEVRQFFKVGNFEKLMSYANFRLNRSTPQGREAVDFVDEVIADYVYGISKDREDLPLFILFLRRVKDKISYAFKMAKREISLEHTQNDLDEDGDQDYIYNQILKNQDEQFVAQDLSPAQIAIQNEIHEKIAQIASEPTDDVDHPAIHTIFEICKEDPDAYKSNKFLSVICDVPVSWVKRVKDKIKYRLTKNLPKEFV